MNNHALKTLLSKNSVADPDPPIQYKLMQIRNTVSPGYGNRYEMTKGKEMKKLFAVCTSINYAIQGAYFSWIRIRI